MAFFEVHSWSGFLTGIFTGCWIGVLIGCAATLVLMGRRVRQIETVNLLLRAKLKVLAKTHAAAAATAGIQRPTLVMSRPGPARSDQAHRIRTAQSR